MTFMQSNKININDIEMYYEIHGKGKPLLIMHGFTGSGAALFEIFKDLTDSYQLIIPDLRGHGRSTNPSKKFTHRQAAIDVLSLLKTLNIEQCDAIGFSAGGNTLLHIVIQQPNIVQSMVVVSATSHYPNQAREIMKQVSIEGRSDDEWNAMRKIHLHGDEQIKMLWQQAHDMSVSYDDMNLQPNDFAKIKAKTLIVQGDRDPIYPVEISVEMYRQISNASLWIIPNGGHGLANEWIPQFKNVVNEFLK